MNTTALIFAGLFGFMAGLLVGMVILGVLSLSLSKRIEASKPKPTSPADLKVMPKTQAFFA